ncbi:PH domain-containing protein [Agromyces sp. Soil535]|uniref:PH domain-containing protein n=1 Tax=Agromyces sp. Soil535 TaxID=1736390 RepID=UPI0009E972C3|nr:PH domain-containing protein [Agromyces sp. Soil535]
MSVFTLDPHVDRYLIADEGEVIIDEVYKHWAAVFGPILELFAIIPVLLLVFWLPSSAYWVPLFGALALLLHALWRMLGMRMDRFVITNMRVFRVHGILSQHVATMPISRILDISVHVPILGRIFNYGHFVFESAAQEQGLREIRYVGSPTQRGLTIQRVIQRSGLRGAGGARTMSRADRAAQAAAAAQSAAAAAQAAQTAPVMPAPGGQTAPVTPNADTAPVAPNADTAPIDVPWWRAEG